ncbi:ABC transporter ATP-binding protein [Clostridium sp. AF19-22AC]|jgi:ABC-2 type transport system ATP-binding protein|uniref:ATP-binding cassette domain-containing protein n=1 Tax=Clostridia TaxID=186801 RepID=UPI000E50DC84|nr:MULTISPECIES: ABC transporter ATP-binding protein [Clostridia]RHR26292.1 ABC transporter ATP-binding protein [Clostridium sp. AF19-22AC]
MSDVIIKTNGLTKDYGKGRGIFDINLEVHKGEVFGFVGTNGSGKTTTIRNMMGFIRPDSGSSTIDGLDSWKSSADIMKNVSYVPGEIAFPALKTGTEFLKSQAKYLGVTDFKYMNHIIELLQLDPTANLKRMSKGMKQKTAIVAALMGEKQILVLDVNWGNSFGGASSI